MAPRTSRPASGRPSRPASGRPSRPARGRPSRPARGRPSRPASGRPSRPASGRPSRPASGRTSRPASGRPSRPASGRPSRPASGRPSRPASGRPSRPASGRPSRPASGSGTSELTKRASAKPPSAEEEWATSPPGRKEAAKRTEASEKGRVAGKRKAGGTAEDSEHCGGQEARKKLKGHGGHAMVWKATLASRNRKGELVFEDFPNFRPNLTPKEVLQAGSFGGTYFRPIYSGVTKQKYKDVWKELPKDWLENLDIPEQVASPVYREAINTYKVKCGGSLDMWESHGWITLQDPYGWFQWYCRFFQGRRTPDDQRQIGRWNRCTGKTGRWRGNLISKIVQSGCTYDDKAVCPVVRQTLQHWGYRLISEDYEQGARKARKRLK